MKFFPQGSNPDYWRAALKKELENPEVKSLLYKLIPNEQQNIQKILVILILSEHLAFI